jgi:hypothetical protein
MEQFSVLLDTWQCFAATRKIPENKLHELEAIELRDSVFPNIDPALWAGTSK